MSHSPDSSPRDRSALQVYQDSWEAIYNLIDEGKSWSGNERNCAFLNLGGERFADISAASGLDFNDDGRAVATADWDFDGRLDFWVTNRTAPRVRFLHNEGGATDRFVAFRLQGTSGNRDAIGARLTLASPDGRTQIRTLHAGDGYLAQSSKWIHFGLGDSSAPDKLVVRWPGGGSESFGGIEAGRFYKLTEGSGRAEEWHPPREGRVALQESPLALPTLSTTTRTWVSGRIPFPAETYRSWREESKPLAAFRGRPLLVNLWSGTCAPCLAELRDWNQHHAALQSAGLQVLALCVDEDPSARPVASLPFDSGVAPPEFLEGIETVHRALLESRKPLPVPCSVLLDSSGLVAAIYKGSVSPQQLLADLTLLDAPPEQQRAAALPFPGRWSSTPLPPLPRQVVGTFMKAGRKEAARAYTLRCLAPDSPLSLPPSVQASLTLFLGDLSLDDNHLDDAAAIYERLFTLAPDDAALHREVGVRLVTKQRVGEAIPHLERAVALDPNHLDSRLNLASLHLREGRLAEAAVHFRALVAQRPDSAPLQFYLASALQGQGLTKEALVHFREAHRLQPGSPATNNLAWILATHRDDSLRDGREAVALAEQACRSKEFKDPVLLHTLAAAYAESGQFDQAVTTAERALAIAKAAPADQALLGKIAASLQSYRNGRPLRE